MSIWESSEHYQSSLDHLNLTAAEIVAFAAVPSLISCYIHGGYDAYSNWCSLQPMIWKQAASLYSDEFQRLHNVLVWVKVNY